VLDDALQFYVEKGGKFTKGGMRVKNGKHIFMHHTKFPCVKQPPGSVKEAFYALHYMKGIMRDSWIRALPTNLSMDFVSQEHGVPRDGPKRFERRGLNV
jgi:hypothetical protein